ncbi:MAG: YoaK family protein [Cypionkella sp.]
MPVRHRKLRMLRQTGLIAAHRRSDFSDRILATILAAIAGCANAGGFILLGSYTSHMTGYLSQLADQVALQNLALAMKSVLAIGLFVSGAATSAFLINWARRHARARQYTLPIGLQGALFVVLAAVGALNLSTPVSTHLGLGLIAFIMGLQNATITKLSGARIRTTHATGMITDVGIELGRAAYGAAYADPDLHVDRRKLSILTQLLGTFLIGGVIGAFGYGHFGYSFSLPLAAILLTLALIRR